MTLFSRTDQEHFLQNYHQGYVGLTATPGAGKTTLLIRFIAQLLAEGIPIERILVLSYTRAASQNFRERLIKEHPALTQQPLDTVCTIHSCAYRLIQPHLERLGYENRPPSPILSIQKRSLVEELVLGWLEGKEKLWQSFLVPGANADIIRIWRLKLIELAEEGISLAKQQQYYPFSLRKLSEQYPDRFFLSLVSAVLMPYQQRLFQLNLVDFDDMVNLAIQLLEADPALRTTWQEHYTYLLEDEAQDSTAAQHRLLQLLAGPTGNWVRVGDPNQAIFSSFTAADPRYLRDFCDQYRHEQLTQASRSVSPIIETANAFLEMVVTDHPHSAAREAFYPQYITPTPQNPAPTAHSQPRFWQAADRALENRQVLEKAQRYLRTYPQHSVGILSFAHRTLDEMAELLRQWELPFIDRRQGGASEFLKRLTHLLRWIYDPFLPARDLWLSLGTFQQMPLMAGLFSQMNIPDWLDGKEPWRQLPSWPRLSDPDRAEFVRVVDTLQELYRRRGEPLVKYWLRCATLIDPSPEAHLTAVTLAQRIMLSGQATTLPELVTFLQGQRGKEFLLRFSQITAEEMAEVPGQIELCTLHSAKGREWDAVFLTGVTEYWFPTDHQGNFQGQVDYVSIYPQAQLKAEFYLPDQPGVDFTAQLKDDIITERLRLLYVGLTRPRYYVSVSCHGQPAQVFQWLQEMQMAN